MLLLKENAVRSPALILDAFGKSQVKYQSPEAVNRENRIVY